MAIGAATICRRLKAGSTGCPEVMRLTRGPMKTSSPIVMPPMSFSVQLWLMNTSRPTRMFTP
jgi:hypothetical protein